MAQSPKMLLDRGTIGSTYLAQLEAAKPLSLIRGYQRGRRCLSLQQQKFWARFSGPDL